MLALRSNPLIYPAGSQPGLDPSHPMSSGCLFSGVASGGNFVNLLTGAPGVLNNGGPGAIITSVLGPSINPAPTGSGNSLFTALTPNNSPITMAAMLMYSAMSASYQIALVTSSGGTAGVSLGIFNSGGYKFNFSKPFVADVGSSLVPQLNVPYFVVASSIEGTGGGVQYTVKNLLTGQIQQQFVSNASVSNASNGSIMVGQNTGGFSNGSGGPVAAAGVSQVLLSANAQAQWAQDPWSFWYPRRALNLVGIAAGGGGFKPYWAANTNIPILGTGTY